MFEEIIKKYRNKSEFCKASGISPQYLRQIELGIRPIPPKLAKFLYKEYGIPLHISRPDIFGDLDNGDAA